MKALICSLVGLVSVGLTACRGPQEPPAVRADAGEDAGIVDGGPADGGSNRTCRPSADLTCTAQSLDWWVLAGRCGPLGTCTCMVGFHLDLSGHCAVDGDAGTPDGGWRVCEPEHPLDCSDDPAAYIISGVCNSAGKCECLSFATARDSFAGRCAPISHDGGWSTCFWGQSCEGDPSTVPPGASGFCEQDAELCSCSPQYPRDAFTNRCYSDTFCLTNAGFMTADGGRVSLDAGSCGQSRCEAGDTCALVDGGVLCLSPRLTASSVPQFCFRPDCGSIHCAQGCTCVSAAAGACVCP